MFGEKILKSWLRNKEGGLLETPARVDTPISMSQPPLEDESPMTTSPALGLKGSITEEPPTDSDPQSPTSGEKSIEERLFTAMDNAILSMVEGLLVTEDGEETVNLTDSKKMAVLRLGIEWMAKSKRIRPDDGDEDVPRGIQGIRAWIGEQVDQGNIKTKRTNPRKQDHTGEGEALAKALGVKK